MKFLRFSLAVLFVGAVSIGNSYAQAAPTWEIVNNTSHPVLVTDGKGNKAPVGAGTTVPGWDLDKSNSTTSVTVCWLPKNNPTACPLGDPLAATVLIPVNGTSSNGTNNNKGKLEINGTCCNQAPSATFSN